MPLNLCGKGSYRMTMRLLRDHYDWSFAKDHLLNWERLSVSWMVLEQKNNSEE